MGVRAVSLCAALLSGVACGQEKVSAEQDRAARKYARELEIPQKRGRAADALLALGAVAVEPLLVEARHPELEVARKALEVLVGLGHDALSAVPELERMAKGDDGHAAAAAWALARLPRKGTFLITCMEAQQLWEVSAEGEVLWKSPKLGRLWSVEPMVLDHFLVTDLEGKIREYDREGTVIGELSIGPSYSAQRLIDGNTLVTDFSNGEVQELDPKGEVVWRRESARSLMAKRLPNGNTLYADFNDGKLFEIDAKGETVWKHEGLQHAYSVDRLPDGSTTVLLNTQKKIVRLDRSGEQVEEIRLPDNPSHALRLPDGWIIAGQGYLSRRNTDGSERWKLEVGGWVGRIWAQ